jgi:hypothetical protein
MWMCKSQNTTLALWGKQHQTPPRPWFFNPNKQKN